LAAGVDTAAHHGGLEGVGGTIAVIGTGIDIVYPARNRELAHQIVQHGCIVSEYHLGTGAQAANFPRRNRIISGLARGVLVVEAATQSGSLITARMAAEQGREVFAIPGSIHSPLARGCHQLIKQGAKLVECAEDILEEFGTDVSTSKKEFVVEDHEKDTSNTLLSLIGYDPVQFDTLLAQSKLDITELTAQLFALEMDGVLEHLPGGVVQRVS
jgi:DNA processing protein